MQKIPVILLIPLLLTGCKGQKNDEYVIPQMDDYGAFLGRSGNNVDGFNKYKYVSVELDEFSHTNIERLSKKGVHFLAYLNVGSLESYRDYYDEYESLTFKDYDNWPDERWIDVTNISWQNNIVSLAQRFKNDGAFGVYLDNVDVYSIAKEEEMNYQAFGEAIKSMIVRINALGLKVLVNGGGEYFDDMFDQNDNVFDSLWAYHQEEVFSLIGDYVHNVFTTQTIEDKNYYISIASKMHQIGKEVFLIEYTTDNLLKESIEDYCHTVEYHYYISSTVELV